MPGPVVDLLEVVAVDDEKAQRHAPLLRGGELALEPLLEPAAVQDPGERVGDGALALALERECGVEGRCDVGREHRSRVEQGGST